MVFHWLGQKITGYILIFVYRGYGTWRGKSSLTVALRLVAIVSGQTCNERMNLYTNISDGTSHLGDYGSHLSDIDDREVRLQVAIATAGLIGTTMTIQRQSRGPAEVDVRLHQTRLPMVLFPRAYERLFIIVALYRPHHCQSCPAEVEVSGRNTKDINVARMRQQEQDQHQGNG